MAMDTNIVGALSGAGADVNNSTSRQLKVITGLDAAGAPAEIGGTRIFGENDSGSLTGTAELVSPEVDVDYRMRVSQDLVLDNEEINYAALNTGKHNYGSSGMTNAWAAGQITTNSGSVTTVGAYTNLYTYAFFPNTGTSTLSADFETSFSALPVTNTFVEIGLGITPVSSAAPTDGVFLRLSSAGLQGIASFNGTETSTGVFANLAGANPYTPNKRYQWIVYIGQVKAEFWVNDGTGAVKLGSIPLPDAQSRMCMSAGVSFFIKHRILGGTASGVLQSQTGAYSVRQGGTNITSTASTAGNRMYGSYQGLSGGTMGSLASYANSANPTAAVPTNTTAALGTGLGGQFWETDTLAVTTDGIICSYQIPAATVSLQNRRLVLRGVKIQSFVQTALTGGGYVAQWSLAFGHTAVSLATAETATTKAPRRLALGIQAVGAAAAASTVLSEVEIDLGDAPVYINPGEYLACVKKKVGTAPSAGVIAHVIQYVYGWE